MLERVKSTECARSQLPRISTDQHSGLVDSWDNACTVCNWKCYDGLHSSMALASGEQRAISVRYRLRLYRWPYLSVILILDVTPPTTV